MAGKTGTTNLAPAPGLDDAFAPVLIPLACIVGPPRLPPRF